MNYLQMKQIAKKLLYNFGNTKRNTKHCKLYHKESDGSVTEYKGLGVYLKYNSEAIGLNNNVIKAGDAKIICQFDIIPTETIDIIEMEGEKFSIVNVGLLSPDNITKILYTLQVRKN